MTRAQLEHIIRAAATIAEDDEIIVIGSQSVLGQFPDAPAALTVSNEADVYPKNHPERSDLVDGSIGELSPFHETFGYYAQGVGPETAVLPLGWEQRLVVIENANTRGARGLCLEIHDLLLSKYVADRDKDRRFTSAAVEHALVERATLTARLEGMSVVPEVRARVLERIAADFDANRAPRS
ncbi:MAG: hypothetical protein KF819_11260 [Labilithrix sp.]|nr:hypothetical protein [Labilithrix sp.]